MRVLLLCSCLAACATPRDPIVTWHVTHAEAAYAAGDYTAARMAYAAARELAPQDAQLGLCFYRAQAALAAEVALPLDEEHARLTDHWIDLLLERYPDERARWLTARGNLLHGLGETQAAIAALSAARTADPRFEPAVALLASLQVSTDRPVEAEATLEKARQDFPKSIAIRAQLADVMTARKGYADAIAVLGEALRIEPSPGTYVQMGQAMLSAGDTQRADVTFREALRLSPDYPPAMAGLGYAKLAAGDKDQARMVFARYLETAPKRGASDKKLDEIRSVLRGLTGAFGPDAAVPGVGDEVPGMPGMKIIRTIPMNDASPKPR